MSKDTGTKTLLEGLARSMTPAQISTDRADLVHYGQDWTRFHEPAPSAVVFPAKTEEVVDIVRLANTHGVGLVPSGGRTGLSGGAVAAVGEVVVSFERMNKITAFNPLDRTVACEAGVTTGQLQDFGLAQGLYYPVDFASAGSSQIGGNVATNAGGVRVIRYGMTRDWVTGLDVVTGAGETLALNQGLIKNATGYDLRHLFIGSEGTLGFVVNATMRLTSPPGDVGALLLGVKGLDGLMNILERFRPELDITAFEFFCDGALAHVVRHGDLPLPLPEAPPYYALIEYTARDESDHESALGSFESCVEAGWVTDGIMGRGDAPTRKLWQYRERVTEAITQFTPFKADISVTVSSVPDFLRTLDAALGSACPDLETVWFGHVGDGNLHLNILKPEGTDLDAFQRRCKELADMVFAVVEDFRGSISAEHGVGLLKKAYLGRSRSAHEIAAMRAIKSVFDPNGIMNPGKIF